MVVMALDHTRDFFHSGGVNPTDLARTWPALFFTRWVTHVCAPVFVLLAGAGAYLAHKPRGELARFLLTRGLWLVALELTVVNFAWTFDLGHHFQMLQVIWAIGWAMVALAALVWLPAWAVGALGLAIIAGHNLLDGVDGGALWMILHRQHRFEPWPGHIVVAAYPLLPWLGVIAAGYGLGALLERPDRRLLCALAGGAAVAAFVILRAIDRYGDLHPMGAPSLMAFLNCTKYPPSLDYLLMTLGPALLFLAAVTDSRFAGGPLRVFGRVPLFYYVAHLFLIHGLRELASLVSARPGWELPVVYAVWIIVVLALYLPCRWYAGVKQRRRDLAWLSYF